MGPLLPVEILNDSLEDAEMLHHLDALIERAAEMAGPQSQVAAGKVIPGCSTGCILALKPAETPLDENFTAPAGMAPSISCPRVNLVIPFPSIFSNHEQS